MRAFPQGSTVQSLTSMPPSLMTTRNMPFQLHQSFPMMNTVPNHGIIQSSGMTDSQDLDIINTSEGMLVQLARMISARKSSVCDC